MFLMINTISDRS